MRRRTLLQSVVLSTSALFGAPLVGEASPTTQQQSTTGRYHNPVFEHRFADPVVTRDQNGMYYAYSTRMVWNLSDGEFVQRDVPILRSSNLVTWEYVGDVFDEVPQWNPEGDGIWAPDVVTIDDQYHVYYTLMTYGDPWDVAIGVTTADHPSGPFEDQGEVVTSREIGVKFSIDPNVFVEDDGTPYLVWGGRIAGIYIAELAPDGLAVVGEKTHIAGTAGNSSRLPVEGGYLTKRHGYYYLFVSSGLCCNGKNSTYETEVGRATSITGPYVNEKGQEIIGHHGKLVLDDSPEFLAPGHNSIAVDDAGQDWILYHAYERGNYTLPPPYEGANRRVLMIDPIRWQDGWPQVEHDWPSSVQRRPTITQENKPKLELSDLDAAPNPLEANELLTVSATAANSRGVGTVELGLYVNGDRVESRPVIFDAGETRPVVFTRRLYRPPENDEYEVTIGPSFDKALPEQSLTFIPKPAEFEYTELQVMPTVLHTPETAEISAHVKNIGSYEATKPVELSVDGSVVATKDITLAPGASTDVSFTKTFDEAGVYDITVGDLDPRSVLVLETIARIQAEQAELHNVDVNTRQGDYTGSGYVSFDNRAERVQRIDWTVGDVPSTGKYTLYFRYAHGDSGSVPGDDPPHTLSIYSNGEEVKQQAFPNTGGWGTWWLLGVTLQLTAGENTISIRRELDDPGVSGVNIDYLDLSTDIQDPPVIS